MNEKQIEEIIESRTGYIYLLRDNTAVKQLKDPSKVMEEYTIIKELYDKYKEKKREEWTYRAIKPLKVDQAGYLYMERAEGTPLICTMDENPNLLRHAGIWLGFFHNMSKINEDEYSLFKDPALSDVIIDEKNKIVIALDPGKKFGSSGLPEEDVVKFLIALINFCLKRRSSPKKSIKIFLSGYYSVSDRKFQLDKYNSVFPKAFGKFLKTAKREKSKYGYCLYKLYFTIVEKLLKKILHKSFC